MAKRKPSKPANVFSLVERRPAPEVEKDWSAEEMLEHVLGLVRAGKVNPDSLMIFWTETLPNGHERPQRLADGLTYVQAIAYLELEKQRVLQEWTVE